MIILNNTIIEMEIKHYEEIFSIWKITSKRALSTADSKEQIDRYLIRNRGMSQIAVINGKIVGTILAGHDGRRGYIHHLAVLPEFRRLGIAHNLVQRAMKKLEEQKIEKTHIFCYQDNMVGQAFWKDFGFIKRDDVFVFSRNNTI